RRGVGPAMAEELADNHDASRIQTMIELFDWHNAKGEERGAGFLVAGIRSAEPYALPRGFRTKADQAREQADAKAARRREAERKKLREAQQTAKARAAEEPFHEYWKELSEVERSAFL